MSKMVDLTDYTEEELIALNHRIVERLRSLAQHRCFEEMARFNLGDTVCFTTGPGRTVLGKVIRANAKTITVLASTGERWRVSPSLVSHAIEGQTADPKDGSADLIELRERLRRS